jgi:hypothetical protein
MLVGAFRLNALIGASKANKYVSAARFQECHIPPTGPFVETMSLRLKTSNIRSPWLANICTTSSSLTLLGKLPSHTLQPVILIKMRLQAGRTVPMPHVFDSLHHYTTT